MNKSEIQSGAGMHWKAELGEGTGNVSRSDPGGNASPKKPGQKSEVLLTPQDQKARSRGPRSGVRIHI